MSERKQGLLIGPFHTYAVCADRSQTCTQCEVSIQALARTGAPGSEQGSLFPCSALISPNLQTTLRCLFLSTAIAMLLPVLKHGENLADCPQKRPQRLCLAPTLLLGLISFLSLHLLAPQQKTPSNILLAHFPLLPLPQLYLQFGSLKSYPSFRVLLKFPGSSFKIHLFPH